VISPQGCIFQMGEFAYDKEKNNSRDHNVAKKQDGRRN